ncbi:MAG: glycogen/starch synthase [Bacteroidaceae bacterium]|nr:glycogen/starch synthase [Bacteroidaceae bacterium]MBQ9170977.1 glycogen/starch synthase [Bacteroidaceae bacterium]MBQ9293965.1 glycogen/starch synthase [Bacteroidaceae bacterium]
MREKRLVPDFIFESSWEVCNKMGGIYTVLSTRAKTLQEQFPDKLVFIGPDVWQGKENPLFVEDRKLWPSWVKKASAEGLRIRTGRWNIPGQPLVILVDFQPYFDKKNELYGKAWEDFGVDSLHAYGDYDEASMFSYAAALVVESFFHHKLSSKKKVVYQAHEWMTCLGALYIRKHVPEVATIFTTHATSIGRSIAGNGKPLYDYLWAYNGTQMAEELNMQAKHSVERQAAHNVDCFTTVSDVTGRECAELLDKQPDVILPNGFEADFVPAAGTAFTKRRRNARAKILQVAGALTGAEFTDDTLIVATSGRYEYRNKGIDVFLEAAYRTLYDNDLQRQVLMIIQVPAWMESPRTDLQERLRQGGTYTEPLPEPFITHNLHESWNDPVLNFLRSHGMRNDKQSRVKVIFVPCYLDGNDGIFQMPYYDLLIADDLAAYPSYYEPWGYTPLEAVAFHVPCITTSLSGFGVWASSSIGHDGRLKDGVEVITRNDYNAQDVAEQLSAAIVRYSTFDKKTTDKCRRSAARLAEQALWKNFITYYYDAYDFALRKAQERIIK